MGFLTTITLYNDHWHSNEIRQRPVEFAKAVADAIERANEHRIADSLDHIIAQPSRHADDHAVLVHQGNTVLDITGRRFERVVKEPPKVAMEYLATAQQIVTYAKRQIKEASEDTNL